MSKRSNRRPRRDRSTHGQRSFLTATHAGAPGWLLIVVGLAVVVLVAIGIRGANEATGAPLTLATGTTPSATASATPAAAPVKVPALRAGLRALFIGDSFAQGYGATDPSKQGFVQLVTAREHLDSVILPVGGTGFGYPPNMHATYAERLEAFASSSTFSPQLIMFEGGLNDSSRIPEFALINDVRATVEKARKLYPKASVVVMGPISTADLNPDITPASTWIMTGAAEGGAALVDPIGEHWIDSGNTERYMRNNPKGPAYRHPNTAGHAYLATRLLADLKRLSTG